MGVGELRIGSIGARSLAVSWQWPALPNGPGVRFLLQVQLLDSPNAGAFANSFSLLNVSACCSANVSSLAPYSLYSVTLLVCNSIATSCGVTPAVSARTLSAPPAGVSAPAPTLLSPTAVGVSWSAPAEPNGLTPLTYELLRCIHGSAAGIYCTKL